MGGVADKGFVLVLVERERRRHTFVAVETLQQARLLQSLPQLACRTRQARPLLSMYVYSHSLLDRRQFSAL